MFTLVKATQFQILDVRLQSLASCWFLLIHLSAPPYTVSNLDNAWHASHSRNIWINEYCALFQDHSNSQRLVTDNVELDKEVAITKQSFIQ